MVYLSDSPLTPRGEKNDTIASRKWVTVSKQEM